ncbi:MAG: RsmG family class I SAM-dependent methyltransferase [Actinomycetota bacterium]
MFSAEEFSPEGRAALDQAFALGLLGPGDVIAHIRHAIGYLEAANKVGARTDGRVADLGSGGGLPGLVLAEAWKDATFVLIDAAERRCAFLADSVEHMGLASRVAVRRGRAEALAHEGDLRETFDIVVARSFGPPPVLAECAAPLLKVGGWLVVSEPPSTEATERRWPITGLELLGFGAPMLIQTDRHFVAIEKVGETSERYPRRIGIPSKRPLFPVLETTTG